jgi:hypothetical protein
MVRCVWTAMGHTVAETSENVAFLAADNLQTMSFLANQARVHACQCGTYLHVKDEN